MPSLKAATTLVVIRYLNDSKVDDIIFERIELIVVGHYPA
jgi:hypothetical protein